MNYVPKMNRRSFIITGAAAGGLALGFRLPLGIETAHAAAEGPEVNAWVALKPDETVVIRIAPWLPLSSRQPKTSVPSVERPRIPPSPVATPLVTVPLGSATL